MKQHGTNPAAGRWKRDSLRFWRRAPQPDRTRLVVVPSEPPCACSRCKGAAA